MHTAGSRCWPTRSATASACSNSPAAATTRSRSETYASSHRRRRGGLAAALFLRRAGLQAIVYEQASEVREVGAGIVVSPNMVRLMAKLGLAEGLAAFAAKLEAAWEFRRWQDGRVLFVQEMGAVCERLYSAHCFVAHRADLLKLFQQALPPEAVQLDQRCIEVRQDEHGAQLTFASRNGRKTEVDA